MERPLTRNIKLDREPLSLREYERVGGYEAVRKALRTMTPPEVTEVVKASNLRGRGGAGFPTGNKWSFVPMSDDAPHPRYLIASADEMEPGTFKDRLLLEGDPHQLLEGMITSAYAIQADIGYIDDRAYLSALPLPEADLPQSVPRPFHQPRDEPLYPVLSLRALLP